VAACVCVCNSQENIHFEGFSSEKFEHLVAELDRAIGKITNMTSHLLDLNGTCACLGLCPLVNNTCSKQLLQK
jgi:hypothetical protein